MSMRNSRGFRDLITWQKAMDLIPEVYSLTGRFPRDEQFALTSQVRRAAVSVAANIAEGQGRGTERSFAHHLQIARGSLFELDTLLEAACRVGYLDQVGLESIAESTAEVGRLIQGLINSLTTNN